MLSASTSITARARASVKKNGVGGSSSRQLASSSAGAGCLEERAQEARHAADADEAVALAAADDVHAVREPVGLHALRVRRRRDRVVLAGQQQHGRVADDGRLEVGVDRARPASGRRSARSASMIAVPRYVPSRPPVAAAATNGTSSVQVTELLIGKLSDSGSSRSKRASLARERRVVAGVRFADQHRQQRDGRGVVAHEPHERAQLERADRRRVASRRPRRRRGARAPRRTSCGSAANRAPHCASAAQRAKICSSARCASRATSGPSASGGGTTPSSTTRAHALGVPAQVVLRDARAVRHAVDVPLLDAERRAHALEVLHRDRRRIEARVVVELARRSRR